MSIRGEILNNIKEALETITTGNGYNQTVSTVKDDDLKTPEEMHADDFPALFLVDAREKKEAGDVDSVECDLDIVIIGYVKRANDEDNLQNRRRNLQNDVEKVIMIDERRNNMALKTQVTEIITDKGTMEPFAIFDLNATIRYYHDRNDPSSQANSPT